MDEQGQMVKRLLEASVWSMVKSFISLSSDTYLAFRSSKHLQMNSSVMSKVPFNLSD